MVNDLTNNHKLIGLHYRSLFNKLGPGEVENLKIYYPIVVDYGSDIDPVYTKTLVFTLASDSLVQSFEVVEWKQ